MESAHVLAVRRPPLHPFYFVQDYEPFFYPHGPISELATDSYRFGFTTIALGHMVRERLRSEVGTASHLVPFSCDTDVYRLENRGPRSGVVFYANPGAPRRGYDLGIRALHDFHRQHPDHVIHLYGSVRGSLPFPFRSHGRLRPDQLNDLYNECIAGIAMSFTNVSLVAEEMLASGCIPVVNDSGDSRADLPSSEAIWALPTSSGIADALSSAVQHERVTDRALQASMTVRRDNWQLAADGVRALVESAVRRSA